MKKDQSYLSLSSIIEWRNSVDHLNRKLIQIKSSRSNINSDAPKYFPYNKHFTSNRVADKSSVYLATEEIIYQDNQKILKKLKNIVVSPHKIKFSRPSSITNIQARIDRENHIQNDNFLLARRLLGTQSVVSFHQYENDFRRHKTYSNLRRKIQCKQLPEINKNLEREVTKKIFIEDEKPVRLQSNIEEIKDNGTEAVQEVESMFFVTNPKSIN